MGKTVDGLVDGLKPTVNGLLGTVDKILPLGIRQVRDNYLSFLFLIDIHRNAN